MAIKEKAFFFSFFILLLFKSENYFTLDNIYIYMLYIHTYIHTNSHFIVCFYQKTNKLLFLLFFLMQNEIRLSWK